MSSTDLLALMGMPMIHSDLPSAQLPHSSQDLQSLLDSRTKIEKSLDEYSAVLDRNHIDLTTPLITPDGFPRADIDVANVRIARAAIIRLRNDYKALEKQIEAAVHEAFKNGTPLKMDRSGGAAGRSQTASAADDVAFCFINSVAAGSPAESAGLQKNDKIVTFGPVNTTNHDKLQGLAREVQRAVAENSTISLTISREEGGAIVVLKKELQPRTNWGGRGAVGAHFLPI